MHGDGHAGENGDRAEMGRGERGLSEGVGQRDEKVQTDADGAPVMPVGVSVAHAPFPINTGFAPVRPT